MAKEKMSNTNYIIRGIIIFLLIVIIVGILMFNSNTSDSSLNANTEGNNIKQSTSANNGVENNPSSTEQNCYMKDPQVSVDWYKEQINPDNNQCPGFSEVYYIRACNQESKSMDLSYRICDDSGCASLKVYETIGSYSCIDTKDEGSIICKDNMYLTDIEMEKIEVCN